VVSDDLTSGWEATPDGVPAPMLFAQLALRGLTISPGAHLVEMRYRTPLLLPGAAISVLTLAFLVLLFRRDRARARESDMP
jgi:uncharacterized membrane protein YfhO